MTFVNWFFDQLQAVFAKLNEFEFDGAPLGIIFIGMIITSMVISVYWRGARG